MLQPPSRTQASHSSKVISNLLTAKGAATHDKVIAVALERERRLLSCLSKAERETLIVLLRRVHGNLDAVKGAGEADDRG